jgi:hypothetical protein
MRVGQSKTRPSWRSLAPADTAGLAALAAVNKDSDRQGQIGLGAKIGSSGRWPRTHRRARVQEPARRSTQLDLSVAPMPSSTLVVE